MSVSASLKDRGRRSCRRGSGTHDIKKRPPQRVTPAKRPLLPREKQLHVRNGKKEGTVSFVSPLSCSPFVFHLNFFPSSSLFLPMQDVFPWLAIFSSNSSKVWSGFRSPEEFLHVFRENFRSPWPRRPQHHPPCFNAAAAALDPFPGSASPHFMFACFGNTRARS